MIQTADLKYDLQMLDLVMCLLDGAFVGGDGKESWVSVGLLILLEEVASTRLGIVHV